MSREYQVPELLGVHPGIGQCYCLPSGALLATSGAGSVFVLEGPMAPAHQYVLPDKLVGHLHVYGESLVSFVSRKRDPTSTKVTEELWYVLDFRTGAVSATLHLGARLTTLDHLFLGDRWLRACPEDGYLFHFLTLDGQRSSSVVSLGLADLTPVDGVLGAGTAFGHYDGELLVLDDRTFLYVFRYRPLIIAVRDTGEVVWSAVVPGLMSKAELEQRRPPTWDKNSVWLISSNDLIAVGPGIAVLHRWNGHRASIWTRAGALVGIRQLETNIVGIWWTGSRLTVAREWGGRLIVDDVEMPEF
jgi:hypothetical protein